MARHKDENWNLPVGTPKIDGSSTHSWESIQASILMDIRDELKENNRKMQVLIEHAGWNGTNSRELRGLRRDVNKRLKARCHRRHA